MGLLLPHIRKLSIYPDMITITDAFGGGQIGGGKRGQIKGFSKESRMRLFLLLHKITFSKVTFVTLTYPADYPLSVKESKKQFHAFGQVIQSRYGKLRAIWRLEFQKRGAPHYHILFLDAPFLPVQTICMLWDRITGKRDIDGKRNSVDLKPMKTAKDKRKIIGYISKYIAKTDERTSEEMPERTGRIWGKWNIKEDEPVRIGCTEEEAREIFDLIILNRKKTQYVPEDYKHCSIFGENIGSDNLRQLVVRIVARNVKM